MEEISRIYLEGTGKSPHVDFNHLTGELILSGRSIPENAAKVYEPLLEWITYYIKSPRQTTNFRINLEYYNTPTAIWLAKIIRALAKIEMDDYVIIIHLYFEVDDYEEMDIENIKDIMASLIDNIGEVRVSLGLKMYGADSTGTIVKESIILL